MSPATGGKQTGENGTLAKVDEYTGGEWKLTLRDDDSRYAVGDGHRAFSAWLAGTEGDPWKWTIEYSGAATGENEYVSAVLIRDWKILYYQEGGSTVTGFQDLYLVQRIR